MRSFLQREINLDKNMANLKNRIDLSILALSITTSTAYILSPIVLAADSELNFKIYNPEPTKPTNSEAQPDSASVKSTASDSEQAIAGSKDETAKAENKDVSESDSLQDRSSLVPTSKDFRSSTNPTSSEGLMQESPVSDQQTQSTESNSLTKPNEPSSESTTESSSKGTTSSKEASVEPSVSTAGATNSGEEPAMKEEVAKEVTKEDSTKSPDSKVLQGYVRVVPTGTKIPIVMDTAVDSDTSQEGDEFSARTAEDLTIDGSTAIPAGSIIRGRIASLNSPKHLNRSGSVALKFDTVTTPDNRQIPLVANLVARGGVVHARRGLRDIAIDSGTFALPTLVGVGIGAIAGHSSSSSSTSSTSSSKIGMGGGALIGAGVGAAVGIAILLAKKGKKVDVRPGDELKIELAEDLHMPTM